MPHCGKRVWWRHLMETFSALLPPLWREFTGHGWIPLTKASGAKLWCFDLRLNKRFSKQRETGDLRRHHVHYDVTVMRYTQIDIKMPIAFRFY